MKIEEQKKAVRAGYDMDIIPSDLATFGNEAKSLLEDLQNRNERMFLVTIIVLNTAMKKQKLENIIFQTGGIAQKYNCALRRLDYQQENGFISSLPLGENCLEISRGTYNFKYCYIHTIYNTRIIYGWRKSILWPKRFI